MGIDRCRVIRVLTGIFILFNFLMGYPVQSKTYFLDDFGGSGKDEIPDGLAFQNAFRTIDAAGGGVLQLMEGTYIIDKELVLISGIEIKGHGNVVLRIAENSGIQVVFHTAISTEELNDVTLRNIHFHGNKSLGVTEVGLVIRGTKRDYVLSQSKFKNINLINCGFRNINRGVIIRYSSQISIQKSSFDDCGTGIQLLGVKAASISENVIGRVTNGIILEDKEGISCEEIQIEKNDIRGVRRYPIHCSDAFRQHMHGNIKIVDNVVMNDTTPYPEGGSADQISVFGSKKVLIKNNVSIGGGDMGITVTRSRDVKVLKNVVAYNDRAGLVIVGRSHNIKVRKNQFYNNGQHSDNGPANAGISLYSTDQAQNSNIKIINNLIYDSQRVKTQIQDIGPRGGNNIYSSRRNSLQNMNSL